MKLSTKGRYGLKAMVDLAAAYSEAEPSCVSTRTLAELQGISEAYLERIMSNLKSAGYVEAVRGANGGYVLAKTPADINVGEILRALEGSTTLVDCVDGSVSMSCRNACSCSARPLWLKLQQKIDEVLNSTTLLDMAEDYATQTEFLRARDSKAEAARKVSLQPVSDGNEA